MTPKKKTGETAEKSAFRKLRTLLFCLSAVCLVAVSGSRFTSRGVGSEWYRTIRPAPTPPDFIFPVVWGLLYLLLAVAMYLAWVGHRTGKRAVLLVLFIANLLLNVSWSYFYFELRHPACAFLNLLGLWFSIFLIVMLCRRSRPAVSVLMLPYLLWVSFAGYLNWLSI